MTIVLELLVGGMGDRKWVLCKHSISLLRHSSSTSPSPHLDFFEGQPRNLGDTPKPSSSSSRSHTPWFKHIPSLPCRQSLEVFAPHLWTPQSHAWSLSRPLWLHVSELLSIQPRYTPNSTAKPWWHLEKRGGRLRCPVEFLKSNRVVFIRCWASVNGSSVRTFHVSTLDFLLLFEDQYKRVIINV